jgi:hypothetical protein
MEELVSQLLEDVIWFGLNEDPPLLHSIYREVMSLSASSEEYVKQWLVLIL